ncbi:hypothetical protein ACWAT4_12375 [Bradyrhizobium manausense]
MVDEVRAKVSREADENVIDFGDSNWARLLLRVVDSISLGQEPLPIMLFFDFDDRFVSPNVPLVCSSKRNFTRR